MDDFVEQGLLFDFYGSLLTPHQRDIYGLVVYQDLTLNEIALQRGISKQAVSDLLRRVNSQLSEYENRLGLVAKFRRLRKTCDALDAAAARLSDEAAASEIRRCAEEIRREL